MTDRSLTLIPLLITLAAACGTNATGTGGTGGTGGAGTSSSSSSSSSTAVTSAVSSTASSASASASSSSSSGSGGAGHIEPPPPGGNMPPPANATDVTFAITKLYLGDTDRDGTANKANGWKQYGFDLDGKISTGLSTDLCKPRNNASPKNVYPDGDGGIDNAFGKNILPILLALDSDSSTKVNESITSGKYTLLFDLQKLGPGASYNPLSGREYVGADLGKSPKFDGTDLWPVDATSLVNPLDITSAKVLFSQGYLTAGTWVSGSKAIIKLKLLFPSFPLLLTLSSAVVTMDLAANHKSAQNGTIAGVIPTDTLVAEFKKVAGAFDPSLCSGPTIDSIVSQIEQASDILQDGSQDPTKTCDGISIGLGFDAHVVGLGVISPGSPPPPNPCP